MKFIRPEDYILIGIPVIFVVSGLWHFLYKLSGNFFPIGYIAPVNESIFEHTKLSVFPIFLWFSLYAAINKDKIKIGPFLEAGLISAVVSMFLIIFLYYFYTAAFATESLFLDILLLLVSLGLSLMLAKHIYIYDNSQRIILPVILINAVSFMFFVFTISPPHTPLFKDPISGTYGIFKK